MRFVKRGKYKASAGARRSPKPLYDTTIGNVATKEKTALLAEERHHEDDFQPEDYPSQEPTQKLLTALGRFQRQVKLGETGAPQDQWSDECMNQLIEATEVAFAEGWTDVVKALTQSAQILQTYEDANRADLCVPFLGTCYKILCLMAGDLIVGTIRKGVLEKWRECYERAAEDVRADGLELVSLYGTDTSAQTQNTELPDNVTVLPTIHKGADDDKPAEDTAGDEELEDVPVLEDLPPIDEEEPTVEDSAPPEEEPDAEPFPTTNTGSDSEPEELPPLPAMHSITHLDDGVEDDSADAEEEEEDFAIPKEVEDVLDKLCEPLAGIDRVPEGRDHRPIYDTLGKSVAALKAYATDNEFAGAVELCETMWALCQAAYDHKAGQADKFVELAYAFCGHYADTIKGLTNNEAENWATECAALMDEWDTTGFVVPEVESPPDTIEDSSDDFSLIEHITENETEKSTDNEDEKNRQEEESSQPDVETELEETVLESLTPPIEEAEPATQTPIETGGEELEEPCPDDISVKVEADASPATDDASPQDSSVEALLSSAQGALSTGNAGQAKILALQAVAQIAREEAQEAESSLHAMEEHLQASSEAIETARQNTRQSEEQVKKAVEAVSEGESTLAACQDAEREVQKGLEGHETRVTELERQLQRLQEKRGQAVKRVSEATQKLAQERGRVADTQTDLENFHEREDNTRAELEDTRQQVKDLHRETTTIEANMETGRHILTHKRMALADIEQTIAQITEGADTEETGAEMLF